MPTVGFEPDPIRRAAADLRLRPRGHWDRRIGRYRVTYSCLVKGEISCSSPCVVKDKIHRSMTSQFSVRTSHKELLAIVKTTDTNRRGYRSAVFFTGYIDKKKSVKFTTMKFHKNPCDGSRAVPCRQTKEWLILCLLDRASSF